MKKIPAIGILQGRLTPSNGRGTQFFPEQEEWEKEFKIAKSIGFKAIELLVKSENPKKNPIFHQSGIKRINELKKQFQIKTPSIHGFYSANSNYPDILKELIEGASQINAKTILISFFKENILHGPKEEKIARSQLQKPLKYAEKNNICFAIETEKTATDLIPFIDSFESKSIGIYYDIGNLVSMGVDVSKEIQLYNKRIFGVHIKDRKLNDKSVPIGTGDTNWPKVLMALKKINYVDALIMQGARVENKNDIELNKEYYKFIKNILNQIYG